MALNPSHVINGAFGTLKLNQVTIANVMSVEYTVELDERPIKIAGTRRTGYKTVGVTGTGTLQIYRIDSEFIRHLPSFFPGDDVATFPGLQYKIMSIELADPESGIENGEINNEVVVLKNVKINRLTGGFNVDAIIEQTLDFTFESVDSFSEGDLLPAKNSGYIGLSDFS